MRINHNDAFRHAVEQGFEFFLLVLELLKVLALCGEESGELVLDGAQQVVFRTGKAGGGTRFGTKESLCPAFRRTVGGHGYSFRQKGTERAQTPPELCPLTQCSAQRAKTTDKGSIPDPLRPCVRGKEQKEMEQE